MTMDIFLSVMSNLRWQDALDIALNSYILFRLYVIFRETQLFRILLGVAVLWFSQRIAVSQGMIITSWVLQGLTAAAALIIIVVFRSEIYAILRPRNIKTLLWGMSSHKVPTPHDSIAASIFELAQGRHGALMVFPGMDNLEEIAQSGISWNGSFSKEMILSIFFPNNPVHDGAIIINGNRITQVGVILPLSQRHDLPSFYGTRHRAAVGLAESTDALVLLVSEERGNVMAAKGSEMILVDHKEGVTALLRRHLGDSIEEGHKVSREKIKTTAAAFISFFIITSVWLSFTRGQDSLIAFDIPIEFKNKSPEAQITYRSAHSVRVHLAGSGSLIKTIRPEQIHVEFDVKDASIGSNNFQILAKNIKMPPGIAVNSVNPQDVRIMLETVKTKELPLQVNWVGKLGENLILEKAMLFPARIKVTGPDTVIDAISTIYTEKVPLESVKRPGAIIVSPVFEAPSLSVASGSPERIEVFFTVKEKEQ